MEKKTCPKCKQSDNTDFSTCKNCGWNYSQTPPRSKAHDITFPAFLRNGGLIVVLLAATWFIKPVLNVFMNKSAQKSINSSAEEIDKADEELEKNPANVDALLKRANHYYILGEIPLATNDYNAAVSLSPQSAKVFRARAAFFDAIGDKEKAKLDNAQAEKLPH